MSSSAAPGTGGFKISGESANDFAGSGVSSAGDFNGDGFDDFVVGAPYALNIPSTLFTLGNTGSAYVVFGTDAGFPTSLDLTALDGTDGFELVGGYYSDRAGASVAGIGDINGDGFDDLIVGSPGHGGALDSPQAGAAYVVFGTNSGFAAEGELELITAGTGGFRILGQAGSNQLGDSVAGLGDVNGDGLDDILVSALSMPHSPRYHDGKLWLLNSGTGYFGHADLDTGKFEPVAFCPGYLRGLSFHGHFAIVGLSKQRQNRTFSGLALDSGLTERDADPRCGLYVIDLRTGSTVHWLRIEGIIEELYDVVVLPGVRRATAIGFVTDEIRRVISVEPESG